MKVKKAGARANVSSNMLLQSLPGTGFSANHIKALC